ncbi:MAG: energy transducer TonB [candidate division KSB1 bacterium]|nr:energy transducer TonB [candidate division KSB1 bacterium]
MDWTRRHVTRVMACLWLAMMIAAARAGQEPRVTFFQVRVLAGYEGLAESDFPSMESEPTVMVVPAKERPGDAAAWLKELFRLESVDPLELETIVEVVSPQVSGAQPSFFDAGESGEFRVWWFGGTTTLLAGWLNVALGVDWQGEELIAPLQVLTAPTEMVVVAQRVAAEQGIEELQSLSDLKEPSLILILVITAEQVVASSEDFRPLVDRYLALRAQQKPTGGTIPLAEDPGYELLRELFAQHFRSADLEYGTTKRVPVSAGGSRLELTRYDTPPQLVRGNEAIRAALLRVFEPAELSRFAHSTVKVLINEKGNVEEVRLTPLVNQEVRKRWWRALKLLRWQPALLHNRPVRAWTVIPIGEALK